ncbi:MAG: phosphate signaling complex protein PhoU [Clostridia bacterium]|nr:phosphate signaling complex protein PhoU [Clostridia bacterium]
MSARVIYDQELKCLKNNILKMGAAVENRIQEAIKALIKKDINLAQQILQQDEQINKMEVYIQDRCVKLIATQQPLAGDLRMITTALKIITDLERVGDHAVDISQIVFKLADEQYIKPLLDIPRMSQLCIEMLSRSLDAYVKNDIELSKKVCLLDDEIDGLYEQILRELLIIMMQDAKTITQATYFLLIAKYLERVADHATNIAEWVIYNVTGKQEDLNK